MHCYAGRMAVQFISGGAPEELDALDAYSITVSSVVEQLAPAVASVRVARRRGIGAGSAVLVNADGLLVTSAHVVAGAPRSLSVTFSDGEELVCELVGRDALSDLAVLRADTTERTPATLGDASGLRVGQLVVAIGNPHGYGGSVTAGVVSGLGRALPVRGSRTTRIVENVIQTDAALNPGNSGGALADGRAHLVGINTAVAGIGLGLAVPINDVTRAIVNDLIRDGRVRRAYIGVAGGTRPLPPRAARTLGRTRGAEIVDVVDGSPAHRAGLRPGDTLVSVDGVALSGMDDLQRVLDGEMIGRPLPVELVRDGDVMQLRLVPAELGE
jgi:S1-C subfamily serine protease